MLCLIVAIVLGMLLSARVLLVSQSLWLSGLAGASVIVVAGLASVFLARWLIQRGIAASAEERGECLRCLYDLCGLLADDLNTVTCPECGARQPVAKQVKSKPNLPAQRPEDGSAARD
ncbi:MAG: hypothetical protein K2X32_05775 [Phycisphaerales bacterium]|nr:hypothetical protein [Phycisphaerales bacterium]